ncbi:MAG: ABC transporter permease [Geminicoccaceae bacterium]
MLLVLAVTGTLALLLTGFVSHAPNRIVTGTSLRGWELGTPWRGLLVAPLLVLLAGAFLPARNATLAAVAAAAALLASIAVGVAGAEATRLAATAAPAARTSLGAGFWIVVVTAWLALADATRRLGLGIAARTAVALVALLPVAWLLAGGALDDLSILKEYANRRDVFAAAVVRHLVLVGATLLPALLIGLPLGVLAWRRERWRVVLFGVLNVIQTIPSIAMFGLLLAPLAGLAAALPALGQLGISGIGPAPAIIALTLYALLPVARATQAGLGQVPAAAVEAAAGMGMTPGQIFRRVELPLALPVLLAGLRITVVQTIGLAAVAALIGAGGLGSLMFQGLLSAALDLVLLGVIPIVALAVLADAALAVAAACLEIRAHDPFR